MIYSGKYAVTSPFGQRMLHGVPDDHRGIDVVGITDKHICAVVPGTVAVSAIITNTSDRTWEWGNYVRVDGDDGRRYYYCHMSRRLVTAGRRVKAGDHLGIEGNTGYSFGSHCHFEVRDRAGNPINPAPFLGIPNAVGTYGTDWRTKVQKKFGLSEQTMKFLDGYAYAADLYRKLGT
ncbi:MAG: M23 family metallopeptidase [Clostridia bacterium]|nr:M23 family metallopeptidase [Clostridia bacterium]